MLIPERQSRLRDLIARRGMCDFETLASELRVSQSTVRRDVKSLAKRGVVKRTHGGAIWVGDADSSASARPYAFDQRMAVRADAKRAIARAARALVKPADTILIDGGTTTFHLAHELGGASIQLVTNSLPVADLFRNDEAVELVITGGLMYPRYGVLLGPLALEMLGTIHPRTLFFSVAGIHAGALYNQNQLLVEAELRMIAQAQQAVLLADSSKFGQQALARLCALSDIDIVVTDREITDDHRAAVRAAGCKLIIAE